ncbi:MAG TPA: fumarylacetoacetate hydrolase family protein [Deltaproteobacteria bacterium]|jgi:2-keto-4-pentenoate hydratase/2-oxohepta-3-ene-1,7-dioic acid hydratase in catechol pathway|nr:fumarylacetoacetate hydrolase family protein [Deltaproteobacteria bacterium]HOI06292.1 fumarylacetoacetate hydrolase family protein [Deltaproteobacteria bacterium]
MKIGRAIAQGGKAVSFASVEGGGFRIFDPDTSSLGDAVEIERFLAPVQPGKIVAVGLNYRDHAREMGYELPKEPVLFMKPSTAVIGPFEEIRYPAQSSRVDYEAELAVVMGRTCRNVPASQAKGFILGYTCLNDVTARDLQTKDGQWTRAKSFDTFAPIGPWIVTDIDDPHALDITARLNGEVKQSSNTSNLIFSVFDLVAFISGVMTLNPGDVIATGTPSGVGPMQAGDEIEIEIKGIGVLKNKVVP